MKRKIAIAMCIILTISFFPVNTIINPDTVNATAKYKTVKNIKKFNYSKYLQGGLTKAKFQYVLESITSFGNLYGKKKLTTSDLNGRVAAAHENPGEPLLLIMLKYKNYDGSYKGGYYYYKYKLSDVNKALSAFTNMRYKPNKQYTFYSPDGENTSANSDNEYLYFHCCGFGFGETYCAVNKVKYNSTTMIVDYNQYYSYDTNKFSCKRFRAYLKKQTNGKYKIVKLINRKATTKEKVSDKYKSILRNLSYKGGEVSYRVLNLDGRGQKELLVCNYDDYNGFELRIYTYKKGKAKRILTFYPTEYRTKIKYYKKSKGLIIYDYDSAEGNNHYYYKMNKARKYKKVAGYYEFAPMFGVSPYYVIKKNKTKYVKKGKFKKTIKKVKKGKGKTTKVKNWRKLV